MREGQPQFGKGDRVREGRVSALGFNTRIEITRSSRLVECLLGQGPPNEERDNAADDHQGQKRQEGGGSYECLARGFGLGTEADGTGRSGVGQ